MGDGPAEELDHAEPLGSEVLPLKLETKVEGLAARAGNGDGDVPQYQGAVEGGHVDGRAGLQGHQPGEKMPKPACMVFITSVSAFLIRLYF